MTKRKKCAKRKKSLDKSANQIVNASIAFALRVKRNRFHKKETTEVSVLGWFLYRDFLRMIFFSFSQFLKPFLQTKTSPSAKEILCFDRSKT